MKSKLYIAVLTLSIGLIACRKEESTVFPDYDKNWLVVEDDPSDASTHARFEFFKETGIPFYINDTIGIQQRKDLFGKDYTHYEVLSMNYSLGVEQVGAPPVVRTFKYCKKADVAAALAFFKAEIIPVLPKDVHVPSILLLESFTSNAFGNYAFKAFNTVLIGEASKIPAMDAATKARFKGAVMRALITNAVLSGKYDDLLTRFYTVSRRFATTRDIYNMGTWQFSQFVTGLPTGTVASLQTLGFISSDPRNTSYTPYTTWIDVSLYLEASLANTDAQFRQLYGSYPNIMTKYGYIRQILADMNIPVQ